MPSKKAPSTTKNQRKAQRLDASIRRMSVNNGRVQGALLSLDLGDTGRDLRKLKGDLQKAKARNNKSR